MLENQVVIRLGKIEKFILSYLLRYEIAIGWAPLNLASGAQNAYRGYRTQIGAALFRHNGGKLLGHTCRNLRKQIPSHDYDTLQIQLTKSLKALEKKGLITRIAFNHDHRTGRRGYARPWIKKRRWCFRLTELGRRKTSVILNGGLRRPQRPKQMLFFFAKERARWRWNNPDRRGKISSPAFQNCINSTNTEFAELRYAASPIQLLFPPPLDKPAAGWFCRSKFYSNQFIQRRRLGERFNEALLP